MIRRLWRKLFGRRKRPLAHIVVRAENGVTAADVFIRGAQSEAGRQAIIRTIKEAQLNRER